MGLLQTWLSFDSVLAGEDGRLDGWKWDVVDSLGVGMTAEGVTAS
jgi:hypothetical protein